MDDHSDDDHQDDTADLTTDHLEVTALLRAHRHLLHEPGSRLHEWYLSTPLSAARQDSDQGASTAPTNTQ